jgi:hypothetical protein
MSDMRWLGGDSGENAARDALIGNKVVGLTHTIDRESGDTLAIELSSGQTVILNAGRLHLRVEEAVGD